MVIKNKDGSVYKINQPNPIMMQQERWDSFTCHNMDFAKDVVESDLKVVKPQTKLKLGKEETIKKEVSVEIQSPPKKEITQEEQKKDDFVIPDFEKKDNINTPPPTEHPDPEVLRPKSINDKLKLFKKDVMHCMLAQTKETTDPLYEEKKIKITYVRSFTFENIIIKEDDMQLVFWSHLEFLTKNSVVYPKNNTRRWWKINSIQAAQEGSFFTCTPTNIQPSFNG